MFSVAGPLFLLELYMHQRKEKYQIGSSTCLNNPLLLLLLLANKLSITLLFGQVSIIWELDVEES